MPGRASGPSAEPSPPLRQSPASQHKGLAGSGLRCSTERAVSVLQLSTSAAYKRSCNGKRAGARGAGRSGHGARRQRSRPGLTFPSVNVGSVPEGPRGQFLTTCKYHYTITMYILLTTCSVHRNLILSFAAYFP